MKVAGKIIVNTRFYISSFIKKIKFRYFLPYFMLLSALFSMALYSYYYILPLYQRLLKEKQKVAELKQIVKVDAEKTRILSIINSFHSGLPASEKGKISNLIYNVGEKYKINPALILSVIRVESSFNNFSLSNMGAVGLMQVQPVTALYIIKKYRVRSKKFNYNAKYIEYLPVSYLYNPSLNIKLGVIYFADLLREFKNIKLALFAYNAGPTLTAATLNSVKIKGGHSGFIGNRDNLDNQDEINGVLNKLERSNPQFANFYYNYYGRVEKYFTIYNKKIFGHTRKNIS